MAGLGVAERWSCPRLLSIIFIAATRRRMATGEPSAQWQALTSRPPLLSCHSKETRGLGSRPARTSNSSNNSRKSPGIAQGVQFVAGSFAAFSAVRSDGTVVSWGDRTWASG